MRVEEAQIRVIGGIDSRSIVAGGGQSRRDGVVTDDLCYVVVVKQLTRLSADGLDVEVWIKTRSRSSPCPMSDVRCPMSDVR